MNPTKQETQDALDVSLTFTLCATDSRLTFWYYLLISSESFVLTVDPSLVLRQLNGKSTKVGIWQAGSGSGSAPAFLVNDHMPFPSIPGWQDLQDWPRGMTGLSSSDLEQAT